ncbi:MAG: transglutaminase-like domain-containing protein [bacterium]
MIENEETSKFLISTKYCDKDNPEIQALTNELVKSCNGDTRCCAVKIFNWVRDEIKYGFDFWNVKASETLRKKMGMCANKTNLQVAMLRSAGIPAGYMVLRIKKEAIKVIANEEIYEKSLDAIVHVYCCVLIDGEWISADASVDRELYEAAYINVPDWDYIEWDGQNHIQISDNYIMDVSVPYANIDDFMDMPHRFLTQDILDRANDYIEKLRKKSRSLVYNV